ncbi:MAG TPA: FG-GAP-like repeat-containing protein, partial [Luteolibacter sp.]
WSSTAVADWDGDGDLDLFVGHGSGLRVFRNIGTAHNPDFEEVTSGFAGLEAFITSVTRPILAGGDWNGDGFGDLVIGGNTGTLRLIPSSGEFGADGSGVDFSVTSTRTSPALGDMNGDGRVDLLVLLDNGRVSLFLNNGTSTPFSGSGTANYLGTSAPQGTSIAVGDVNQDGRPDVLLADSEGRIWEFIKNATAGFTLRSKVWGGSCPGFASGLAISAVDIEGDGDIDLITGVASGGIMALRDPKVGRPTGLVAVPGANSVQLDWDANWQSRIRGYSVYRASSASGPWSQLPPDTVSLPGYLHSPVNPGVKTYYHVTGVSDYFLPGNSSPRTIETEPSEVVFAQAGKVILSVPPVNGAPGKLIKIGLSIENAMGISGADMKLKLHYDPAKLTPWEQTQPGEPAVVATGLSGNLTFTENGATANGELVITGSDGVLEPGAGKLFDLHFKVAAGLPVGTALPVTITSAALRGESGNALSVQIVPQENPTVANAFVAGDLNGDGQITAADKELLQNLLMPEAEPPTVEQLTAGDLNGDGNLDEMDLVLLMQLRATP